MQDVGLWPDRWLQFLDEERPRHGANLTVPSSFVSPQSFVFQAYVKRGPPNSVDCNILFVDAAPKGKGGFRFGFFVPPRGIQSSQCPDWIDSLQRAELFAIIQVFKLAKYLKWSRILVGTDSFEPRQQVKGLRYATGLQVQNKLLR